MQFKNSVNKIEIVKVTLKKLKKNRLLYIIFSATLISILLIIVAMFNIFKVSKNGIVNETSDKDLMNYLPYVNIFTMKSYNAEYEAVVYSNKNKNIYNFKEAFEYVDSNTSNIRVEYQNEKGEIIYYSILNNKIEIGNFEQKNKLILEDYSNLSLNLYSISSFVKIYSMASSIKTENPKIYKHILSSSINISVSENYIDLIVEFNSNSAKKYDCDVCKMFDEMISTGVNVKKMVLKLNKLNGKPMELNIFDENEKIYVAVTYKIFTFNGET